MWWYMPVVPAAQEAETGGLLKARSLEPRATKGDLVSKRQKQTDRRLQTLFKSPYTLSSAPSC
jgi:hypothetical protein